MKKDEIHPCATVVQQVKENLFVEETNRIDYVFAFFFQLLPSLELIIYRYRSTAKLSECWSRAIRFILRSMSSHAKLFSQRIVNLVSQQSIEDFSRIFSFFVKRSSPVMKKFLIRVFFI